MFLQGECILACVGKLFAKCLLFEFSALKTDLRWKNDISHYNWHRSFIQTVKCSLLSELHCTIIHKQHTIYTSEIMMVCTCFRIELPHYTVRHWLKKMSHISYVLCTCFCGRRGSLMVSALESWVSVLGPSPGWRHCVVFLGKTLYSHSASLHLGV